MRLPPAKILVPSILGAAALLALLLILGGPGGEPPEAPRPGLGDEGSYGMSGVGSYLFYEALKSKRGFVERRISGEEGGPPGNREDAGGDAPWDPAGEKAGVIVISRGIKTLSSQGRLSELKSRKGNLLVVLPKYFAYEASRGDGWIEFAELLDESEPLAMLCLFADCEKNSPSVARSERPAVVEPTRNVLRARPSFRRDSLQLVQNLPGLHPIVSYPEGILLGELPGNAGGRIWILADPDPVSNHSILIGENLKFSLEMVEQWMKSLPGAPVIFEESHVKKVSSEAADPFDL